MDSIIETVSLCADESDDEVRLQVIKVLLTAITSPYCEVHEASLLLAVRTCFHIHMTSKNQSNKTSVKAALTQILSVVNVKMEVSDARSAGETEKSLDIHSDSKDTFDTNANNPNNDIASSVGSKSETLESDGDTVPLENFSEEKRGADAQEIKDDESSSSSTPSKYAQEDLTNSKKLRFPSVMHKDSFLLFRALCIISMKANQDEGSSSSSQADAIALPNK